MPREILNMASKGEGSVFVGSDPTPWFNCISVFSVAFTSFTFGVPLAFICINASFGLTFLAICIAFMCPFLVLLSLSRFLCFVLAIVFVFAFTFTFEFRLPCWSWILLSFSLLLFEKGFRFVRFGVSLGLHIFWGRVCKDVERFSQGTDCLDWEWWSCQIS